MAATLPAPGLHWPARPTLPRIPSMLSRRGWLIALTLLGLAGWWRSPVGPGDPRPAGIIPMAGSGVAGICRPPAATPTLGAPLQSSVPSGTGPFRLTAATLTPLAGISLDARVLSRADYGSDRESHLAPTDLALGWGRMREDAVLRSLEITQGGRWYRYRWWGQPPIPPDEIVRSSANMHFIPADEATARTLAGVRTGDRVQVDGWLVEARAGDGWTWRSSLTREDSGDGACEVIYVCSIRRL